MKPQLITSSLLLSLLFIGAGCITVSSGGGSDGGVYLSSNRGDNWVQKVALPRTNGQLANIGGVNVTTIVQDPQDPKAIYIGTTENGLYYSYDAGASWFQPEQLKSGRVPAVAVSSKDKCTIYAAAENKVLKSEDCSRTWSVAFFDTRTDKQVTSVVVDHYTPSTVWAATSSGDVMRSTDSGTSWTSVLTTDNYVVRLYVSPQDSRTIFVATRNGGLWRTVDGGTSFVDLSPNYKSFSNARDFYDLAFTEAQQGMIVMACKYGLLQSIDNGDTWKEMPLLTPPNSALIYSLAIDPKDQNVIYYGTATTFNRSINGGANWVTKRLPSSRAATSLLIDRSNPNSIFLGVTTIKK